MRSRILGTAAVACAAVLGVGIALATEGSTSNDGLRDVASFGDIADRAARSKALFAEAARVLTHPRCMNCHPASRQPTQGDDMHPHVPLMMAGDSGFGPDGMFCTTCHGPANRTLVGSRIQSIPGAEPWLLAPASMAWQGLSVAEICAQVKDPARNGERSLADIVHHMGEDHLVAWAWHPGEGRTPAPGSQEAFGALVAAWVETGAECPD